jgi:hypothetical protein
MIFASLEGEGMSSESSSVAQLRARSETVLSMVGHYVSLKIYRGFYQSLYSTKGIEWYGETIYDVKGGVGLA